MKKLGLIFFVLSFFLVSSVAWAKDSGIRFSDYNGEVMVGDDLDDRDSWNVAELDMILNVNDYIGTGDDSTAVLSLADMTTFVMKPNSEIKLSTPPEKESKIELITGKVWVNVKRMIKDGTMDVKMSQAVAGIKGTNITCSSNKDGSENRIKVLRGHAKVLINETQEEIDVQAGEELVVKKGGKADKQEINIQQEQKEWEDATSKLGESIDLGEIPEVIKQILENETNGFAMIKNEYSRLLQLQEADASSVKELQIAAERFLGVIMEDNFILASMKQKVSEAGKTPDISVNDMAMINGYQQQITEASSKIQGFSLEIDAIMKHKFKIASLFKDIGIEVEAISNNINSTLTGIEAIKTEIAGNPTGKSQDWFLDALETSVDTLSQLDGYSQDVQELLVINPEDKTAQALLKKIADEIISINTLMKNLQVVEIDSGTMTEIQEIDDVVGTQIVLLQNEIDGYNSSMHHAEADKRLSSSLRILNSFAKVRRLYSNGQRLYDSTMRAVQSSKFKTSEQEEFESLWNNISDKFQQLGIVASELQNNIENLENQLSTFLK